MELRTRLTFDTERGFSKDSEYYKDTSQASRYGIQSSRGIRGYAIGREKYRNVRGSKTRCALFLRERSALKKNRISHGTCPEPNLSIGSGEKEAKRKPRGGHRPLFLSFPYPHTAGLFLCPAGRDPVGAISPYVHSRPETPRAKHALLRAGACSNEPAAIGEGEPYHCTVRS